MAEPPTNAKLLKNLSTVRNLETLKAVGEGLAPPVNE